MLRRHFAARRPLRWALLPLLLTGLVAPTPAAPVAPAWADHAPDHQAVARLQVVLKRIHVEDDQDWFGEGEIEGQVSLSRCPAAAAQCSPIISPYDSLALDFGASSGETRTFDRVLPLGAEATGFPVYPGDQIRIRMTLEELDEAWDHTIALDPDEMGDVNFTFGEAENWRLGNPYISWSTNSSYWVEFEIRRAPVPDLSPVGIKTLKLPGTTGDTVCVGVVNREFPDAGPFKVTLRVNGAVPTGGVMEAGGLPGGQAGELCVETTLPPTAELVATVDQERTVIEYSEANNRLAQPYTAPQGAAAPATGPSSGPMQADLAAMGIRVKSAEQGGGDGCRAGRNDITVVVKNHGGAAAPAFAVRLVVDGEDDEAKEKAVAGLDAGKDAEVTFDDVRLRRGMRALAATVDAKKAIGESDEDNNELTMTVNCRAG